MTLGKPLREVVPELVQQPQVLERLRHVLETGQLFEGTEISMKWDRLGTGELVEGFFNLFYQPVRAEQGRITGVLTFSVEVTEQVLARRKAEGLAEELRLLLDPIDGRRRRDPGGFRGWSGRRR